MNQRAILTALCMAVISGGALAHAAEVVYSESFDRQGVQAEQSVLAAPIGWTLIGPNDPAKNSVGNVFLASGNYGWSGNYLEGGTATANDAENCFRAAFPTVVSGKVTLTCQAHAAGETSAGSSVGLGPSQERFFNRGGGWFSTPKGWEFWVGRVHSGEYPILDGRTFGPYTIQKEPLAGAHDATVELSMTVDLDHNKAWGQARWRDAEGRVQEFQTPALDWDSVGGNVSNVMVTIDKRSGHSGIALDDIRVEAVLPQPKPNPFDKSEHIVFQRNGEKTPVSLPAEMQWISQAWDGENAQMPYLAYMPEKDRVLMLVAFKKPCVAVLIASDDHGKTWSRRRWLSVDKDGRPDAAPLGLTYLGSGRLVAFPEDLKPFWFSSDYGQTWERLEEKVPLGGMYTWDPLLLVPGIDGRIERVVQGVWKETGVPRESPVGKYSQAYLRSSLDGGRTWDEPAKIPQWLGVNELSIIIARNGDWVAACRLDNPPWSTHREIPDLYSGLGVSISKDQGQTWSDMNVLYEFGRHHPSMVVLPDGRILMTYVVRFGYPNTPAGFPEVGVEAIVSSDNGQTWDMDHRYVLARWEGNLRGEDSWFCSVQSTSTVLLPDNTLLTAFGTGFRDKPGTEWCKMDVAMVRWRIDSQSADPQK